MPELIILFLIIIVSLVILYLLSKRDTNENKIDNEGDHSIEPFSGYLQSCPKGFTSFVDSSGDTICCDGTILAGKCTGNRQCILNSQGTAIMPNCAAYLQEQYSEHSKSICPESMNYFEDNANNITGCTNGELNDTMTGPKDPNQPICKVYNDMNKNITSKDSCYNAKQAASSPCFGKQCTKRLIQTNPSAPVLVGIEFMDDMGMIRIAYTKDSLVVYLDAMYPGWRERGMDVSKNINVAEVAKAVFIDKTMSSSDVQI
jgi:hypothetical protein